MVLKNFFWDYSISAEDIEAVLRVEKKQAGYDNQEMIFLKILESFSRLTLLQLSSSGQVK